MLGTASWRAAPELASVPRMDVGPRFFVVTDLLLGAVYADSRLHGDEVTAVKRLLGELLDDELPEEIVDRIDGFDPDSFDLLESAEEFADDPATSKRTLLELVAAVFDADGEVDFDEDDYMRELAEALGLDPEEYEDLVIEYEIEDLSDLELDVVIAMPPPIPD